MDIGVFWSVTPEEEIFSACEHERRGVLLSHWRLGSMTKLLVIPSCIENRSWLISF